VVSRRYVEGDAPVYPLRAIAREYAGQLTVARLDIDNSPSIAARYGIEGTPTVVLFKQGKVAGEIAGSADKAEVEQMLQTSM
jgi:thioredoxin 1